MIVFTDEEMHENIAEFLTTVEVTLYGVAEDPRRAEPELRDRIKEIAREIQSYLMIHKLGTYAKH